MRLLFLLFSLLGLSACMDTSTPVVPPQEGESTTEAQILCNQTEAQEAQEAYKRLQKQREKE